MRAVVLARFFDVTATFESVLDFPYDDIKGIVTVADGVACSHGLFASLPWVHADGSALAPGEVEAAWRTLQSPAALATDKQGGAHYAAMTALRLTTEGMAKLAKATLERFEKELWTLLPNWDHAPAHAQMATLLMAWAYGGLFPAKWPRWRAAFIRGDWSTCAAESVPSAAELSVQNSSFHRRVGIVVAHFKAASLSDDADSLDLGITA